MSTVDIYKEKLPAGWAYALKPSRLESAVAEAKLLFPVSLYQRFKVWAVDAPAFAATFHPRGSYLGGEAGRISVSSYAIPS
ncbi:hypothetical protein ACQ1Z3_14550, partial [Enterococcus faecalis]|uniref:hypothetical protein n=1 Tax=Enterococcus faecalis TaxID=1351 RepID=UPI003D6BE526